MLEPIDRDMRYMHVAIRKNIQDRYRKIKFMEKYGTIMMNGLFLLIMLVGLWFLLDKMTTITGGLTSAVESATTIQAESAKLLTALDNICRGSGVV